MKTEQEEYDKELAALRRHCDWGVRIGVLAVLVNGFNAWMALSKVL